MGEGLLVTDASGNLTYMNLEAERFLRWSQEELIGKNIYHVILQNKNRNASLPDKSEEDWFNRKHGLPFPVAYITTPYMEDNRMTGSIMVFRDISQQKNDQELIHFMAFHDDLTKLPNIRFFKERLAEIIRQQSDMKAAVLVLNIDRFKNFNEALGHSFGDLILQAIASRLTEQIERNMMICRLTGDEFAILFSSVNNVEEIVPKVERIQTVLMEPLQAQQLLLNVTLSAGVVLFPDDGTTTDELL